jgi:TonB family protein
MELNSIVLWYLAGVTIRSLGLAVFALAAILVFRSKSAAALHAVLTVVVAGMLASAALTPVLPPLPVRVLREVGQVTGLPSTPMQIAIPTGIPVAAPPQVTRTIHLSWQQVSVVAYAAGLIAFLIRLAFGYVFTCKLVRASRPVHQPWAAEVYESSWISVPLTVGWLRPKILLPLGWDDWGPSKLQAVLAHEGTHIQRGDWAIAVVAGLNRCVFWFHPLAWWLERRLAFLAEQACDDSALLLVGTEPYAQALLDMAAVVKAGQGRLIWEAMAMANVAEVRQRIERILDETRQIPKGLTRSRWAALISCSVPLVYVASVAQLAPAQAQQVQQVQAPAAMSEMLKGKRQLGAGDVSVMELYLTANPHDLDVRSQLVLYYFANGVREPRLTHILWLIANHPESNQALFASRGITSRTTTLNDASDYTRAAKLWQQQTAAHATDLRVLGNAAEFLSQPGGDFDEAERLLTIARNTEPNGTYHTAWLSRLARLYAVAILGSSGDPHYPNLNPAFASRVKLQLENSTDGIVLDLTGRALTAVARRPQPGEKLPNGVLNLDDHPMLIPMVEMGNRLIARSGQFVRAQPGIVGSLGTSQPPPLIALSNQAGAPIRVETPWPPQGQAATAFARPIAPPLATAPPLITRVDPVYPPLARQAKISGNVELDVTIGTDGHVTQIQQVPGHGHPLLVSSAMEAARQWVYAPIPAAGTIQITVPFQLDGRDAPGGTPGGVVGGIAGGVTGGVVGGVAGSAPPSRIKIPSNVQAFMLISKVEPVYPEQARAVGIEGDVQLEVTIGEDGHVLTVDPKDGHPLLAAAAADAVKQWVYQTTVLNGRPVIVITTVTVPFQLQ